MKLHLIRHGDTEGTERHLYYGKTDLPLSAHGATQLEEQAKQGGYPPLAGIDLYSTGMVRTEETLKLIYGDVPHATIPLLQEVHFGIFEMKSHSELEHRQDYQQWITGDFLANIPPQGESYTQFAQRIIQGLEELIARGRDAIVVCHGGTIAVAMAYFFPREEKTTYDWIPTPGHGYSIALAGGASTYMELPKPHWAGKEYAFFQHTDCEYFPCHQTDTPETFNCLFCYCPLYALGEHCGGNFTYTDQGVKSCMGCLIPHQRDNYGRILGQFKELQKLTQRDIPEE